MSAIGRALAYFGLSGSHLFDAADIVSLWLNSNPPRVSGNSSATKGRNHASQKSRANRRKAGMKARVRR